MRMRRKLSARPTRRVTENLDLAPLIAVCALTVGSLWVGAAFRPTVSAPPRLPTAPDLTLDFSSQPPQTLMVDTVLIGNGNAQPA
jgi:hypothetical protein